MGDPSRIKTSGDVCKLLLKKKYLADVVSGWTPKNECPKADYMDEETPSRGLRRSAGVPLPDQDSERDVVRLR